MRVMILARSNPETEPSPREPAGSQAIGRYTDELVRAGVLLGADTFEPSSRAVRVRFAGSDRTVVSGPTTASVEPVTAYWLWQVRSLDEAVEWVKRAPMGDGTELEVREVLEPNGPTGTPIASNH